MNAVEAFSTFVAIALVPAKAERYTGLAANTKGQKKLLSYLDHEFEKAIDPKAAHGVIDRTLKCYGYHASFGFGAEFDSVAQALDQLAFSDGWLIVVADGSSGIYRPESRWDAAVEITG